MRFVGRWLAALAVLCAVSVMHGPARAAMYLDTTLGEVTEAGVPVAAPKPVQILFQFKTDGTPNARATEFLNKQVTDLVTASGLFSEVKTGPVEGGAIVSVTIENLVEPGAASKGFVTGLTLGLKGSLVTDNYIGTLEYVGGLDQAKLVKTAKHALHTTVGAKSAPPNGVKVKNGEEGARTMTRQLVQHLLAALARDPAFNPDAPPLVAAVVAEAPVAEAPAAPAPDAQPVAATPADAAEAAVAAQPAAPAEPVSAN